MNYGGLHLGEQSALGGGFEGAWVNSGRRNLDHGGGVGRSLVASKGRHSDCFGLLKVHSTQLLNRYKGLRKEGVFFVLCRLKMMDVGFAIVA